MASITKNEHKSYGMGLHDEVLTGRTQQTFFNPEEGENFFFNDAFDVDFNKRTSIDVENLECLELNKKIKECFLVWCQNFELSLNNKKKLLVSVTF